MSVSARTNLQSGLRQRLSKLGLPGRPAVFNGTRVPPYRRTILFENLEPRLLLSADLAPELATNLADGISQFKDWAANLAAYQQLGEQLPVINTALGSAVDLPGWLQDKVVNPVQSYLLGAGTKTTDGLVSALAGVAGLSGVSGDQYGNEVRFDLVLDANRSLNGLDLTVPQSTNGMAITAEGGALDLTASLHLDFSFGFDLTPGLSVDDAFFVKFDGFSLAGDVHASNLNFAASVGFLGANVSGGSLDLDADVQLAVANPDADAAGHITLGELQGTTLDSLVGLNLSGATVNANLPIAITALGSFNPGAVQIAIGGNPFTGVNVNLTGTNAAEVSNFGRLTPFAVNTVMHRVAQWLEDIGGSSSVFGQAVPFAQDLHFEDVLDFATALTEVVNNQLESGPGVPDFNNAQQFAARLATLLGLAPEAISAGYNTSTNQLTFFFRLDHSFANVNAPVSFDLNLAPLGGISTSSTLSVGADGRLQFTLGFDLSPFESILLGNLVLPANGVLSADALFQVALNGAAPVAITVTRQAGNTTRSQLVANVNTALANAGLTGLTASLVSNKLQFKATGDMFGASLSIYVSDPATNTAKTELGLNEIMADATTPVSRAFLRDIQVTGNVHVTASDIDASAQFGFVGVDIVNGTATADATAQVLIRNPANTSAPVRVGDFFTAISNIATWATPTTSGTASATLPVQVQGGILSLGPDPRVQLSMSNVFNPGTLSLSFPDLTALTNYQNLDFNDVLAALNQVVTYLGTVEGFSFLNLDLPVIDKSVTDLLSFVPGFGTDVSDLQGLGVSTLQQLEAKIEQAFGLNPAELVMTYANNDLRFALHLEESLPAQYQNLNVNLDLAQLAGYVAGGVPNLAGVGSLIDVGGSADLSVTGGASMDLIFGFDLTNPATPRAYIHDDTDLALNLKVTGSNLDFDAAIGPLGLFIRNGTVSLANGVAPAAFTVGLKPVAGDRYYTNQWNTSILNVALTGQASATLPVYFPLESNFAGDIALNIGNLANIAGTTTLSAPNLAAEIGSIDLFDDLGSLIQGIDLVLAGIEDAMDGEIWGIELPIVGDNLRDAANFISDLRTQIVPKLQTAFAGGDKSATMVKNALFDVLGNADLLGDGGSFLNIIMDRDNDGIVNADDIELVTTGAAGDISQVQFNLKIGQTYTASIPIGFDIGLPGLGLQASDNSAVQVAFTYGLDIGLGVSRADGVYIDTSANDELFVEVEATTPNMAIGGELAFLRLKIEDDATNPTHLTGSFAVDLQDPVGGNNRLTFNELAGGVNFAQVVDVDLDLEAEANLKLTAGVMGGSDDVASEAYFDTGFPQFKADFHLLWTFDVLNGFEGNLQDVSFNNVRLDLGQFLSSIVTPIVNTINPILDPVRPILDVLNARIPVISDITGDDVTFIEMASYLAPELVSPETADFVEAAGELVDFLDRLDTLGSSTYLDFGSFNLNNLGSGQDLRNEGSVNFGGLDFNARKTDPSQALSDQLASKTPGFKDAKDDIKGTQGSGFSFPLLDDPTLAFKLLLGQDVDIFRYDMPEFSVGFDIEQAFGPVYAPPPVYVTLEGGLRAGIRFGFGYDTRGIRTFAESIDQGAPNPLKLFDGFYIADTYNVNGQWKDLPELFLEAHIGAGVRVSAVILSLEVEGGIFATLGLNLHDIDGDGKMRFGEFLERIQGGNPLCVFDFEGEFGAYLELEVRFGLDLGLVCICVTFPFEIARVTLVSFSVECDNPPPILATLDEGDGTLYLNMGDRAAYRVHQNTTDGDESFKVTALGADSVMVEAFGYTQIYGTLQEYDPLTEQQHHAVTRIVANGGLGNDTIEIDGGVLDPVELAGGDGDDIIIAGGGAAFIQGGAGRDSLKGSSKNDRIYGHGESGAGDDGADDIIVGRGGDDQLYGQGGNDQLDGGAGNDQLYGGGGQDNLFGEAGDDWLYGGSGQDLLYGEQGADTLMGEAGDDWLYGGADNDVLYGNGVGGPADDGAADRLFGDLGTGDVGAQDRMGGTAGNDTLYGQAGNDFLAGEGGDDTLYGGSGNDEMLGNDGVDLLFGEAGNDLMRGGAGTDTLHGGDNDDTLYGDSGDDIIHGDDGDDVAYGGTGEDLIYGGTGNDTLRGQENDDRVYGEAGDDKLYGDAGEDLLLGGIGADTLVGGEQADRLYGGEDSDFLFGSGGDDQLYGEAGDDYLFGNLGRDRLYGGIGNDFLAGNEDDDHLLGEEGNDSLFGDAGEDLLEGGSGADSLSGGIGNDVLLAGVGLGKILHGDEGDDILVGADSGGDDADLFDGIYQGDRLYGDAGDDQIWGLGGADRIESGDGKDQIWGGEHGDLIYGNAGEDMIHGGFGADWIYGGADGDYIDGGLGADRLNGEAGEDEILGGGGVGDQLWGGADDDVLRGSDDGADIIQGEAGRDRLYGNGGNDHLLGGDGDDIIEGNAGDDRIEGGAGSDVMLGGADHDILYGHLQGDASGQDADWLYGDFGTNGNEAGSGADQLFGQSGNDLLYGEGGDDLIALVGVAANGFNQSEVSGGTSNVVDFGAGEVGPLGNFTPPTPTPAPTPISTRGDPMAPASLPSDPDVAGLWRELAGSASGGGISGGAGLALEPSVATDPSGNPVIAWADARNGNFEIYVLRYTGGAWTMLSGSAQGGGVSATAGSSRQPSIALAADGSPVVAWIETTGTQSDVRVAQYDASANGGAGAWVALGGSLGAGGVSATGHADGVHLVNTAAGLVAVWLDDSSGTTQVYARRFNGSTWAALGSAGGSGISAAPSDVSDLAVTTDGSKIAIAWARDNGSARQVYVKEYNGGSWQALAGSDTGTGVSNLTGDNWAPTLAYQGGDLFVAWQRMLNGYQNLYAKRWTGGAWSSLGALTPHGAATDNATIAKDAQLASGGGQLWLFWTDEDTRRSDQPLAIYAELWNGTGFAPRMAADADGDGISETGGRLADVALTVDASGRPVVAWSDADRGLNGVPDGDPAVPAIYLRADAPAVSRIFQAADTTALVNILNTEDLGAGDFIALGAGNFGAFTIVAQDAGVTLIGAPGRASHITGAVTISAGGVTLQGLTLEAGLNANGANSLTLRDNLFLNAPLILNAGNGVDVIHNVFSGAGIDVQSATAGRIAHNDLAGTLNIAAPFTGSIDHNDIHGAGVGVIYGAAAALSENRIHGNGTGISTSVAGMANGLGFVAGSGVNHVFANTTGIQSTGAQFQNQHVYANTTGVSGSGIVGGTDLALANLIEGNGAGVSGFTGTVQYSRITGNGTGIVATNGLKVWHNLIYRNTSYGLLISGVADVRVYQNTFYAPSGDNIRLQSAASNVEVRGNILWARSGYDIYVANDSQTGFFSDYNNLYADQSGRIGYWTRDFVDVLDWQADIARFDLHSIGATVVNPLWAKPQFLDTDFDDFRLFQTTAGLRFTSPDVDAADARLEQATPDFYVNLLTNPGFESGLTGWSASAGAGVKTGSPAAYEGSQYFQAGNVEEGQVQQTVNLLATMSIADLDSGDFDLVFGGRLRSAAENPADRGSVVLEFYDTNSNLITLGNGATSISAAALNASDRWELVGGRATIPAGARFAVIRFTADRDTGSSNDAWFDQAYLYAVSEAYVPDLGAYGHGSHEASASADGRIMLRFPDLYTDWEKLEPLTIRWETVNNVTNSPVRIDLMQDTADGPALLLNLAASTSDDGEFIWIPGDSGIDFGAHGLRIQVSLVHDMTVLDRGQESFSVPEDGDDYYVDDGSNAGDQYTPGATGSNRHTGKTPDAPKSNPVNVLREYTLDSFSTLYVDTGDYPMIYSFVVSGSIDTGLGLDEGFLLTGPSNTSVAATLFPAIPGDQSRALIDLNDADFVTIRHLTLLSADRGLYVHNGSDAFSASWITASGHKQDGIYIDTNAPFASLDHLTGHDNTRYGIYVGGDIAGFSNGLAYNNGSYGIYVNGGVDSFADNIAHHNNNWGFYINAPGNSQILRNEAYANRYGMYVSNSSGTAWVGSTDLAAGNGNLVHNNTYTGLHGTGGGVHLAGNSVWGHTATNYYGLEAISGTSASYNLVFGNYHGINAYTGAGAISYNRVYNNTDLGIYGYYTNLTGNVVYSNNRGITWTGGNNYVARNNLVYDNNVSGLSITGSGLQVLNNTIVQQMGNAVTIDGANNIKLYNNILWVDSGNAISVSSNSQVGFESDYNLFYTTGLAQVGQWQGASRATLNAWRVASFTDANSVYADPLFVDMDGADGVIGYASATNDGRDDDFHPRSLYGSSHGGSLAPVRDPATGLPVAAIITSSVDGAQSPAIDRGRASDDYSLEPAPNGGFINIGAYGGTAQASQSPSQYITVFAPNGGESVPQESGFDIRWRAHGFGGNVDIEVSDDNGGTWNLLADSETNDGGYAWSVDPLLFAVGSQYLARITAETDPAITDASDRTFTVTEPIHIYYVNVAGDADFSDNEYTVAAGSDLNDGLTAATPMASIRAVLERYDLDAGDIILVDTGEYLLTTNISITDQDSGVVIRGAMATGHTTLLNRGNTASTSYTFQFSGADDVTLDHLSMTGAYYAVYLANVNSDNITVSNSEIYRNANHGVYVTSGNEGFEFVANKVRENGSYGVYVTALRAHLADNEAWGNGSWGLVGSVSGAGSEADWIVIEGNRVFDNAYGISGASNVLIRNNESWGQSQGIGVESGAIAEGNVVWGNTAGIDMYSNGIARNNIAFANSTGITGYNSLIEGNRVYGNTVGITDEGYGRVVNNLVYDNVNVGIQVTYAHTLGTDTVINNTVHQVGGKGIDVTSSNVILRNNILWQDGGTAITVANDNQGGFSSDYNLFHLTGGARLAWWEDRAFADRTDWYYETGFDQHGLSGDPRFVDIDGADDVNGWDNGFNFSQIIDDEGAGHAFTGGWTEVTTRGYGGDVWTTPAGDGGNTSTWTFTGLEAGYYRIAVTWPYDNTGNSATNARYTVRDGNGTPFAYREISQNYASPNDYTADGADWEVIGYGRLEGDTLVVEVANDTNYKLLADAVRIERYVGDFGADDDYRLQADSPAIDRGSLNDWFLQEPQPNGGRIDLGAYGNTADATPSADPMIQVTSLNGLEKLEVGQSYQIYWRSAGLGLYDPVALINTGGAGQVQNWLGNAYQTVSYYDSSIGASTNIDLSGVTNPAPDAVYRSYSYVNAGVGNKLAWTLPADDGDYVVRLHFVEPSNIAVGARKFDISLNGNLVADDYDIRAAAGTYNKGVVAEFNVSLTGGAGLLLELINQSASYGALISGIELLKVNAGGVAAPAADLEVSLDNGATWSPIASGLAMDRYGRGGYTWTPTQETNGNTALIRATGHAGATSVSDVSDEAFLIANGGQHYYVNLAGDADFSDNEYTTAAGDNENSGKTADAPMASLAALLRAYDLDVGDVIHVDTGTYSLATNIVLDAGDSGVTIEGAKTVGHTTTLNRGNTASGREVFEFQGADDVTLDHLAITGGQYGIYAGNVESDRVTVTNSDIYGNTLDGLSFSVGNDALRMLGNRVHGNSQRGLDLAGSAALIEDNEVFGNGNYGIYANYSGAVASRIVVRDNQVHDNASHGIYGNSSVWIVGNDVYGHTNSNLYGVVVSGTNAVAEDNDIHGNYHGVSIGSGALVTGNEIYGNSQYGVQVGSSSSGDVIGNRIYGNSYGIVDSGYGHMVNNVLYTNTNVGISLAWRHSADDLVANNTIYQPVGDAIRLASDAQDVHLYNNILWVAAGYGINANPSGVTGLQSDYNLIYTAGGAARAGLWNSLEQVTLAAWQSASGKDAHSVNSDPMFLDIDGADNVLGATPASEGDGHDDNFGLKAHSAAIDAGYAYRAPRYDIESRDRHDDPSTANTGDGWPLYVANGGVGNLFTVSGTAKPYQSTQGYFNQALGFDFDFYGTTYTSVTVSTEGYLQFAGPDTAVYQANNLDVFQRNVIIAPFWDNLTTSGTGRNIYVDTTTADQVTFRWSAALQTDTTKAANFSVTLFSDGSFRFDYGAGNTGFTPRVGVSAGNGFSFVLAAGYDGAPNLASANSLLWSAQEGLTFYDMGAYEFQGDSNDSTPPQVTGITHLPADGSTTDLAFSSVQVSFSESLDGISARSPANYELLFAGADGFLDTPDDIEIGLTPAYSFPETDLTLQFDGGVLADGLYRLRLSGTLAIYDTAGNPLDGDANGTPGGDYLRTFTIDRSSNTAPVAVAQVLGVNEDGSVVIQLTGNDADGDALSFGIYTNPAHGTLSGFDPVTHQVTYTPDADYWGADSFQFQVDDGKLGTDTATVTLNVLPVNDVPDAPGQTVNVTEDTPASIVLPASDKETPRAGLTFNLVTGPAHGSLTQGANGIWTYTPDADYFGDDGFTYMVTDRGGNDADPASALTSTPGTIQITVNPANDAPTLDAVVDQEVNEGDLVSIALVGHDPEGLALTYSLVSGPAGASVDAASGLFTWSAVDGDASYDVTVAVSDGVASVSRGFQILVRNVAPSLSASGVPEINLGEAYTLTLGASDPGADTLNQWEINWGDGNIETLAGNATSANHTYALDGDYTIQINATDEDGTYAAGGVQVKVISPNNNPVAQGQFTQTEEDQPFVITLGATDVDGDPLTYSLLTLPAHGTLGTIDPITHQVTYTPEPNFVGQVEFIFQVTDGRGGGATGTINIKVLPVNDAPTALAQSQSTDEDTPLAIQLAGTDLETPASNLLFNLESGPAHGSLVQGPGGAWQYIPDADWFGTDSFQFSVTDSGQFFTCGCGTDYVSPELTSAPATVSIQVLPVNDDPGLTNPGTQNLVAGQDLSLALTANDPDGGDTLAYELLGGPSGAVLNPDTGLLTWTAPYTDSIAVYPVTARVSDGHGGEDQVSFDLVVDPELLRVTSFQQTSTGFHVDFNRAFDASKLNTYDALGFNLGLPDIVLKTSGGTTVGGSVVPDEDLKGLTFVKTGGLLAAGTYNVTLDSRADAFVDDHARWLDGNADNIAGGDYGTTFSVTSWSGAVLSLGEFARGPGQAVNLPASGGSGVPINLSNASGATQIQFDLAYDPSLLTISGATLGSSVPAGSNVSIDTSTTPGIAHIQVQLGSALGTGGGTLINLQVQVPTAAQDNYGAKQVLDLRSIQINGGALAVRDDDGLHVNAYLGDASGNGNYRIPDVQQLHRTTVKLDSGFGAYPLMDPVVLGDISGNGRLDILDVSTLHRRVVNLPQTSIPAIPAGIGPFAFSGADPVLSLPEVEAQPGEMVTVPINLDTAEGMVNFHLVIAYPADQLELLDARLAGLTADFQWFVKDTSQPGLVTVDAARLEPLAGGTGKVLELDFLVKANAQGALPVDLRDAALNETRLTLNPRPVPGPDASDGQILVRQPQQADGSSVLVLPQVKTPSWSGDFNLRGGQVGGGWLSHWLNSQQDNTAKKKSGWRLHL